MAIGCAIPFGIWFEQHWILQILLAFIVLGNLFIAYKLRDMQNIGTSWHLVLFVLGALLVFTILNFIGAMSPNSPSHVL